MGDKIRIYRAVSVTGLEPTTDDYTFLAARTIDPDQLTTYYRDSTGTSLNWYRHTYFNETTLEETDLALSPMQRGSDAGRHASLSEIRKDAG